MPESSLAELYGRLEGLVESWPSALAADFRDAFPRDEPRAHAAPVTPYWLLVPNWLVDSYDQGERLKGSGFLDDVLWAQWCMYLCFRLQDLLLDGQTDRRATLLASDLLWIESDRSLAEHLGPDAEFWQRMRELRVDTVTGAAQVDEEQSLTPPGMRISTQAYSRASAVFKLGSLAVCSRLRRADEYELVSRILDRMAVAGQILDDLEDVQEDFERGRYNYAARCLLECRDRSKNHLEANDLVSAFVWGKGARGLAREVHGLYRAARDDAATLGVASLHDYLMRVTAEIEALEQTFHEMRVSLILSDFAVTSSGPQVPDEA